MGLRTVVPAVLRSRWTAAAIGVAVLFATALHLGTAPFLQGLLALTPRDVVIAVLLCAIATAASAWRWVAVSRGFGVGLSWPAAVGLYYRSQFLNSVLPGGVLGDVHRAIDEGRRTDRLVEAARTVAVERTAGQSVQLVGIALVLMVLGIPEAGITVAAAIAVCVLVFLALVALACLHPAVRHALAREGRALRAVLRSPAVAVPVVVASLVVLACHATLLAVAASAVGADVPVSRMVSLALIVLAAAALPLNAGGWGPREGAAAWAFAASGYGAAAGVATATLFGVLSLIALVPGAVMAGIAPVVRRRHLVRTSLRGPELRAVAGRLHRHRDPAAAPALQPGGLRPRG
ncbi:lysylphosphatidylglycerol synthase transmembrane domain-containing protein [Microbacterium tumbae]